MANPFDDETADYLILANALGQYSLWPEFREIPAGWRAVGPKDKRRKCLEWIEANWEIAPSNAGAHAPSSK